MTFCFDSYLMWHFSYFFTRFLSLSPVRMLHISKCEQFVKIDFDVAGPMWPDQTEPDQNGCVEASSENDQNQQWLMDMIW